MIGSVHARVAVGTAAQRDLRRERPAAAGNLRATIGNRRMSGTAVALLAEPWLAYPEQRGMVAAMWQMAAQAIVADRGVLP